MLTLVIATAAALAVVLVVALVVILIYLIEIRRFTAETSTALERVDEGSARFARRIEQIARSVEAAANELAAAEA